MIGHVLRGRSGGLRPVATTALRLQPDQVVHDGQIVRRQIPDDVDVVLKEPEVDRGSSRSSTGGPSTP